MSAAWNDTLCQPESWHPAACLFPLLPEHELMALADVIREHGLLNPIVRFNEKGPNEHLVSIGPQSSNFLDIREVT